MIRDIGVSAEDFVIKDPTGKRGIRKAKKFDIGAVETDEINIIGIDFGSARIIVGDEEYVVSRSKLSDFKSIIGSKRRGKLDKIIRFRYEKKAGKSIPHIIDIWESTGVPSEKDAMLIGDKLALFLTGKSEVIDIASEQTKDRIPFQFVGRRVRVPFNIAFRRGYNVSNSRDLRLRTEGKVLGEMMYNCGVLYDKPDGNNVDICFGVKIREKKGIFVAEKFARIIDRNNIRGIETAIEKGKIVDEDINFDIDDFIIDSNVIDSDDTDFEALKIFENFEFEEIKDVVHFFDYKRQDVEEIDMRQFKKRRVRDSDILGQSERKILPIEYPIISRKRIKSSTELNKFNAFIDEAISDNSNLDADKIKKQFDKILKRNVRKHGSLAVAHLKSLYELYNDSSIFTENKTANNPLFYERLNKFIGENVVKYSEYKKYSESDN